MAGSSGTHSELSDMKAGTNKVRQTSSSDNQLRSNTGDWLISIMSPRDEKEMEQSQLRPQIQKVPWILRKVHAYKECFDPAVASIGPYHHGKPELQTMEELKIFYARQFVETCKQDIDVVYNKVVEVVSQARACYAHDFTNEFDDQAFTRIMFLDGCFVLHFIYSYIKGSGSPTFCHGAAFLMRDLFLLENQLPFVILQALMSLSFHGNDGMKLLDEFVNMLISPPDSSPTEIPPLEQDRQPLHLLDLLRTKLLGVAPKSHLSGSSLHDWHSFRSITELKGIGIHSKKSRTIGLMDIDFRSYKIYTELSLPRIVIDDWTKPRFLNLMAFEMCPHTSHDYGVISYVCFMASLIDYAEDVRELRYRGVILNMLGSDKEVAELFTQLGKDMVPDPLAYYQVKGAIETHYQNKKKVSVLEFLTTHFSSPWTAVGFFIASLVTLLTFIQTFFQVFYPDGIKRKKL